MTREGDWACTNCKMMVYRPKVKCYKCNKTKPIVVVSEYETMCKNMFQDMREEAEITHDYKMENDPEYRKKILVHREFIKLRGPCRHGYTNCYKCHD